MEISYVVNAVRRYWWVMLLCVAVGAIPLLATGQVAEEYVSRAVVLVSPPSDSRVQVSFNNDPDRYVIGQLAVLRSSTLADDVATRVGQGETGDSVAEAITITHQPETDVVDVDAKASDPQRAQTLANAYVDTYFESVTNQVDETQGPEIKQLDERLADVGKQINDVDAAITAALAPYIEASQGAAARSIPTVEQIAPNLVSQKSTLLTQYGEILSLKTQLEVSSKLRVTTQIVQRGALPASPLPQSNKLGLLGLIAGFACGLVGAVVLARLSPEVLDEDHAGNILKRSVVSAPHSGKVRRNSRAALERLPSKLVPFIDGVCVRAEAAGRAGEPLRILVTGSRAGAGTTVLAEAIANRFSISGADVLLIDANPRNPEISRLFADQASSLANFLAGLSAGTPISPRLTVVGLSGPADAEELRRQRVEPLISQVSKHADVVVIDAGAMQNSVSTAHMMRLVDAVVLAIPMTRQRVDELHAVARQLDLFDTEVIAVAAPVGTRRRRPVPLVPPPSNDHDYDGGTAPPSSGVDHVAQPALSFAAPASAGSASVHRSKTPAPKPSTPR